EFRRVLFRSERRVRSDLDMSFGTGGNAAIYPFRLCTTITVHFVFFGTSPVYRECRSSQSSFIAMVMKEVKVSQVLAWEGLQSKFEIEKKSVCRRPIIGLCGCYYDKFHSPQILVCTASNFAQSSWQLHCSL